MGSFIRYSCPGGDIWCPDFCMPPAVMGEEMQFLPSPPSSQSTESDVSNSEYCSIFSFPNSGYVQCKWKKCSNWFPSVDDLATHISFNHTDPGLHGLFYCQWDGCVRGNRAFNARYKMLVHIRTHTNEKPHLCYICSKKFSRAENLKIHARSHTGEKPYVCPAPGCGKAYSNSSDRYKHSRTHETDKPYMCKVPGCTKKYTDPSSLRKHIRMNRHFPWMETTEKEKNSELWENEHQLPFCAPEQEVPLDLTIKTSH